MQAAITVTPEQLPEVSPHVAVVRPVFLWVPGLTVVAGVGRG